MKPKRTERIASRARGENGFVLVVVLFLLVVLVMLATAVAASGSRAVAEAQQRVDAFEGELDMLSTRDTVLYMLATQRRNLAGLSVLQAPPLTPAQIDMDADGNSALPLGNEIRLDGRAYAGLRNAAFALQDDTGLLSPNWAQPDMLASFFASRGVTPDQWSALEAKRLDYQDPDDLHRLDGAEAADYRKAGRPPPSNRTLGTPLEFRRILQWDDMLDGLDDNQLLGLLSMRRGASINVNSAPVGVLALLPGMNLAQAERLVALREQVPVASTWSLLESFTLAPEMAEALTLFPNVSGNLILWDRRYGGRRLVHWTLTPYAIDAPPWRIDYEVTLPRDNQSDPNVAGAPETPLFAPQDAGGEGIQPGSGGG